MVLIFYFRCLLLHACFFSHLSFNLFVLKGLLTMLLILLLSISISVFLCLPYLFTDGD